MLNHCKIFIYNLLAFPLNLVQQFPSHPQRLNQIDKSLRNDDYSKGINWPNTNRPQLLNLSEGNFHQLTK